MATDSVFSLPLVLAGSAPEELGQCGNSVEVTGVIWGRVRQWGEGLSEERHLQEKQRHLINSYIQHGLFSSWAFKKKIEKKQDKVKTRCINNPHTEQYECPAALFSSSHLTFLSFSSWHYKHMKQLILNQFYPINILHWGF